MRKLFPCRWTATDAKYMQRKKLERHLRASHASHLVDCLRDFAWRRAGCGHSCDTTACPLKSGLEAALSKAPGPGLGGCRLSTGGVSREGCPAAGANFMHMGPEARGESCSRPSWRLQPTIIGPWFMVATVLAAARGGRDANHDGAFLGQLHSLYGSHSQPAANIYEK